MRLESAEITIFKAIVELGGFRRAAEELHITQSAVSQSLKQLEDKLAVKLIERGPPITVTHAGRRLLRYAHDLFHEQQSVLEDIERIREGDEERLSLALDSFINRLHAPELITAFCRDWPRVKLKVEELPSRSIIYAVLSGQCELGFGPFQTRMEAFETLPLIEDKRILVISPNCPLYEKVISPSEITLSKLPLIVSSTDDPEQRPSISKLRDQYLTVWEVTSLNLRLNLLERGLGVGYISESAFNQLPQSNNLVSLEQYSSGSIYRQVGIYYKKGRDLSLAAKHFINICSDYWDPGTP